jgi:membrane-associated phospholipid phosphatase
MTGGASVIDQAVRLVPPLLPGRARRAAVIVIIGCTALLTAGAVLGAGRSHAGPLDRGIDQWVIDRLHTHLHGAFQITNLGNPTPMITLTIIVVLACLTVRRVNGAILAVAAVLVANALTEVVLKPIVNERIGHPGALSYPSGHTTSVFTLVAVVAVLLVDPPRTRLPGWLRLLLVILAVAVGVTVGICVIAIQFHYFTDTIGGLCVATATVLGIALLLDAPRARTWMGRWRFRSDG